MLNYMHCWYFFRHMPFPSFIYCHETPSRQPRLFVSFLWWQVFFEQFLLKWNFWACESCILSCNINHQHPASQCYKYNTMTSSSPFLSQGRKTQLLAFFTAHLTYAQRSHHSHTWKRSKLFSFTSWIIKKIQNTLIWWSCNPLKTKLKRITVKNISFLIQPDICLNRNLLSDNSFQLMWV